MQVTGIIKRISATQAVSDKFKKREIVITTEEQYPQFISIDFIQDKCSILDNYKEGQRVVVNINLRGREWTSPQGEVKYFNTINGWAINHQEAGAGASPQAANIAPAPSAIPGVNSGGIPDPDEEDDLPF